MDYVVVIIIIVIIIIVFKTFIIQKNLPLQNSCKSVTFGPQNDLYPDMVPLNKNKSYVW